MFKLTLSGFKQFRSTFTRVFNCVTGTLIFSSDNSYDFHDEIWWLLAIFLKYLETGWNTNNFASHYLQNEFFRIKNLSQTLVDSLVCLAVLLILLLLLMLQDLCFNQIFLEQFDLWTNRFAFIFAWSISPINLL